MPTRPLRTPPTRDFPTIRRSLIFYKTFAYATGTALLCVTAEVILRYVFRLQVEVGGPEGLVALVPALTSHLSNLSLIVLIGHGYLYIAYLISDFVLITVMRYPITRFIVIALGGVVPFLSFITERRVHQEVAGYLAEREERERAKAAAAASA